VERQRLPTEFIMHAYGIGERDGLVSFFPPHKPEHVSHSVLPPGSTRARPITVPLRRLASIMQELGHDHLDLLKLDIEGAEYAVIEDLERSDVRPAQILVEFHHRFPAVGFGKTRAALAALRRLEYRLFAVSPGGEEYGFVRC
jgi:FkbM family methyltransferase